MPITNLRLHGVFSARLVGALLAGGACTSHATHSTIDASPDSPPGDPWMLIGGAAAPASVAIAPNTGATPYVIYVATDGHGVLASTDGVQWASAGPSSSLAVAAMPMAAVAFASLPDGSVQLTKDSGSTWNPTGTSPGHAIAAWIGVVGVGPLGVSSDGAGHAIVSQGKAQGATWAASTPFGTGTGTSIAFGGSTTAFAGVSGSGGGVFKSTNIGNATFTFALTTFPQTDVLAVATAPSAPTTVYAGTNGQGAGVYASVDGGDTWSPAGTGLGSTTVKALAVDPSDPQRVYAAAGDSVYITTDAGGSWTKSTMSPSAVTSLAVLNGTPTTIFATAPSGLYVTKTAGE
jgi:hypothetical protein